MMMKFRFGKKRDAKGYEEFHDYNGIAEFVRVEEFIEEIMSVYDRTTEVMEKIDNLLDRNQEMYAQRIELLFESLENYEDQISLFDYLLYIGDNPLVSRLLNSLRFKESALESKLDLHYLEAQPSRLENMDSRIRDAKKAVQTAKERMGFEDNPIKSSALYRDKWVRMNQLLLVYQERLITLMSDDHSSERAQQLEKAFRQSILNCQRRLSVLGVMIRFGYNSTMDVMETNYSIVQGHLDYMIHLLMKKKVDYNAVRDAEGRASFIQERNKEIESRMCL